MSRGSKVFRPTDLPESNSSGYPAPFRDAQRKRWNRRLGDHGGLKNYGVNFVRVEPGGQSSARHSHSHTKQDEFVYIIEVNSSSSPMWDARRSGQAPASHSQQALAMVIIS
jgi:uncharacterized cupin superfamily protein